MSDDQINPSLQERPWLALESTDEVELWIAGLDRDLQAALASQTGSTLIRPGNQGLCLRLAAGGELYLQTNGDGDVLLDVTGEAAWVAPLISAATGVMDPQRQLWAVPGDRLVQLIFGLSSLIVGSRIVLQHGFRGRSM